MSNITSTLPLEQLNLEAYLTFQLCEIIDSPRSLAVFLLLQFKEFGQLIELVCDPNHYEDPSAFADDYLVTECLKKSPNLPLKVDRFEAALCSFRNAEASCRESNARFSLPETAHPVWLFEVRREFRSILGRLTPQVLGSIPFRHGPGATTAVSGVGSVASDKYTETIHLTANLIPFYKAILGENWHSCQRKPAVVVQGNRFSTVPKNAKTDRGICTEPTLNMYVQLGIGAVLRKRLKRFKVDLDSQVRNQQLAKRAYGDSLATIDLSSASDSVAWKLVQYLCIPEWAHLFGLARSTMCRYGGDVLPLEKVSSMGNGFTFELETSIFLACMRVAVPRDQWSRMTVYGDDIIVPQAYAPVLIDMLNYLGFSVNGRKSFLAGSFFESCGHDYFKGVNVRPFYMKGQKDAIPYSLQLANQLRLYALRRGVVACDSRFRPAWVSLVNRIPKFWRKCRIPSKLGDLGLITGRDETHHLAKPDGGAEGFLVDIVLTRPVQHRTTSFGMLLRSLANITGSLEVEVQRRGEGLKYMPKHVPDDFCSRGRETVRGYLGRIRTKKVIVESWPCGLSWDDKS